MLVLRAAPVNAYEKGLKRMLNSERGREAYLRGVSVTQWEEKILRRTQDRQWSQIYGPGSKAQYKDSLMRGKRR